MSNMHMSRERQVDGGSCVDGRDLLLLGIYVKVHVNVCNHLGFPVVAFACICHMVCVRFHVRQRANRICLCSFQRTCLHITNMSRCLSASTALSLLALSSLFMTASVTVAVY